MLDEIGLFYNDQPRGPGKVRDNLLKGLESLDVKVYHNQERNHTGWLHGIPSASFPKHWLLGPNLFTLPNDAPPEVWNVRRNIVVNCDWVKDVYAALFRNWNIVVNMSVWAVGIDTEKFKPQKGQRKKCLVYHKRGSENNLKLILETLTSLKIDYIVLKYGEYSEEELMSACGESLFAILNTATESQGIAYQEILSMGIPCYVIDKEVWDDRPEVSCPASSAPYFDNRCGIKHNNLSRLSEFLDRLSTFKPRDYILDNLTLEKCASEYIRLLEVCHATKS